MIPFLTSSGHDADLADRERLEMTVVAPVADEQARTIKIDGCLCRSTDVRRAVVGPARHEDRLDVPGAAQNVRPAAAMLRWPYRTL